MSVVERKNIVSIGGVSIGEMCSVRCRERGKWVQYPGKLLSQGSKREMELQMVQLDDPESGSEDDECAQAEKGVEGQAVSCNLLYWSISDSDCCPGYTQGVKEESKCHRK